MKKITKFGKEKWLYFIVAIVFFASGALAVEVYDQYLNQANVNDQAGICEVKEPETEELITQKSICPELGTLGSPAPFTYSQPSGKFTILESKKITADKTKVETGELVNFFTTLKNQGTKKKFLTHICFNHSGGVTFGCLLNVDLDPGEEFPIHNSMMFPSPGRYSVGVTWSQDGTNFYSPLQAGSVSVIVE